ncbi:hypothetical protein AB431_16200 [Mycobacterium sp. EPa45]|nr:hypothetical protein AB431_16200 [Mycobacterium sp. EPa45]
MFAIDFRGAGQGRCGGAFRGLAVGFSGAIGAGLKLFGPGIVALLVGCTEALEGVGAGAPWSLDPHAGNATTPTPANATSHTVRLRLCIPRKLPRFGRIKASTGLSVW